MIIRQATGRDNAIWARYPVKPNFSTIYLAVSASLVTLLTLMILIRLLLHTENIRAAKGSQSGIGGLYKTVITILIESCALYVVSSLLVIGPTRTRAADIFLPVLCVTQVRAPRSSERLCNVDDGLGRSLHHC